MRTGGGWIILILTCIVTLTLPVGCRREEPAQVYVAFSGTVRAIDSETGELFVRGDARATGKPSDRSMPCVVTKDSEIYVNDRFASFGELQIGDAIEVVGFRDAERLVICFAEIKRAQPVPPDPLASGLLDPPASSPADRPREQSSPE